MKKKLFLPLIAVLLFSMSFAYARHLKIYIFKASDDIVYIKLPDVGEILVNSGPASTVVDVMPQIQNINLISAGGVTRSVAKLMGWGYEVSNVLLTRVKSTYFSGLDFMRQNFIFNKVYGPLAKKSGFSKMDKFVKEAATYNIQYAPYNDGDTIDVSYGNLNADVKIIMFGPDTYTVISSDLSRKVQYSLLKNSASVMYIQFGDFTAMLDIKSGALVRSRIKNDVSFNDVDVLYTNTQDFGLVSHIHPKRLIVNGFPDNEYLDKVKLTYSDAIFLKRLKFNYFKIETDGKTFKVEIQ